jgi:hypothetical protein
VVRTHAAGLGSVSPQQARVLDAIAACRIAALGGHLSACDTCGHEVISYNSCRNRHCPQCQALNQARWVERRQADLLPVEYHHVVFTIPTELHDLFLRNQAVAYGLLFSSAAQSLLTLARDPRLLGAEVGAMAVLHTWTQTLAYHSLEDGQVTFRCTDRANGNQPRTMILPATQFLRRFLLHVLPLGFVRIRYFGGLANGTRRRWLALGRRLLGDSGKPPPAARDAPKDRETWQDLLLRLTGVDVRRCPRCQTGRMNVVERFDPPRLGHDPPSRASPT